MRVSEAAGRGAQSESTSGGLSVRALAVGGRRVCDARTGVVEPVAYSSRCRRQLFHPMQMIIARLCSFLIKLVSAVGSRRRAPLAPRGARAHLSLRKKSRMPKRYTRDSWDVGIVAPEHAVRRVRIMGTWRPRTPRARVALNRNCGRSSRVQKLLLQACEDPEGCPRSSARNSSSSWASAASSAASAAERAASAFVRAETASL